MIQATTAVSHSLLIGGLLLMISVILSRASSRLGVPSLLLFIGIGMVAGSEGVGGIPFADYNLAHVLGMVALVYILFSGGLDTKWQDIRHVLSAGASLATVGVLLTAGVMAVFAATVFGWDWHLSLLFGAVVSSTDAPAVFSALRAQGVRLKERVASIVELESGSNDPMAVFLVSALTLVGVSGDQSWGWFAVQLVLELIVGALVGVTLGWIAAQIIKRIELDSDGLYAVFTVGIAATTYGLAYLLHGNGYLAVYAAGITLSAQGLFFRHSIAQFHEGLSWIVQVAMFLMLGLLVFPSQLLPAASYALVAALVLVFVARPLAVVVALTPLRIPWREQLLIGWTGLRGAVPIVLATIPVIAGVAGSEKIFNYVFFIVLVSVLLQGSTIAWVAQRLQLVEQQVANIKERRMAISKLEINVPRGSRLCGKKIAEMGLPQGVLVTLIRRRAQAVVPRAETLVEPGDVLYITGDEGTRGLLEQML